jgi:hypothetical protein
MAETKTKKIKAKTLSRHLNFTPGSYLESTARPLYALCFLLPMIVLYELGTLGFNTAHIAQTLTQKRVVAFIWLTGIAKYVGLPDRLAWAFPILMVVIILLCWHLVGRHSWKVHTIWLVWMTLETVILAVPLLVLNAAMGSSASASAAPGADPSYFAQIVTGIGAGIYEELLFRFIIIGLIIMIMEDLLKTSATRATLFAVLISAALFSAHHYVGLNTQQMSLYQVEPFTLVGFIFRFMAGVYFAMLFRYRGYGITAGAHAAYNIILITFWS